MSNVIGVVRFAVRLTLIVALLTALGERLVEYGPTIGDPDPEGYVSYARALADSGTLQAHRRLPGYPAIMAMVTAALPYSVPWDMFYFHFALTIALAGILTALVWRFVGFAVAAVFLAILAIHSHFARTAIIMFADLPHTVLLYAMAVPAALFLGRPDRWRYLALAAFAVLGVAAFVVHPSGDMRVQLVAWSAIGVYGLRALLRSGLSGLVASRRLLVSLFALSLASFAAAQFTQRVMQLPDDRTVMIDPLAATSSAVFLRDWVAHRMLLCLPPAQAPSALDARIEEAKSRISVRQGYPVEAIVPPGYAPEFLALMREQPVPRALWRERLVAHPFAIVGCTLAEMRSKWHFLLRNLTPFTPFDTDKTMMTPDYPPRTPGLRDDIFWTTGLSLFRLVAADAPDARVEAAVRFELVRLTLVVLLTGLGLVLLDRRFPGLGAVFVLATLGWFVALSVVLPTETRYFMPNMPVFYLAQAMAIVAIPRLVLVGWLGARLGDIFARPARSAP